MAISKPFIAGGAFAGFACAALTAATAQGATPNPDLSGIWGRNWFLFEPPSSGPGPVDFKKDASRRVPVGDYANPVLKPAAAEVVKKRGEISLSGAAPPDPHSQCWPEPTPFTLATQLGMQILQQRDEVILVYLADNGVRHVRMNVPHPSPVTPSWQGDSVGHYEEDTLVIDTIGLKVGPLSMVDMFGTPFSEQLHVIERYRLIDGAAARDAQRKHESDFFPPGVPSPLRNVYGQGDLDPDISRPGLQVEVTVEDPLVFTTPWSGLITYRRLLGEWPEVVCAENTHEYYTGKEVAIPVAAKPDF